jgi:pantetheine-phosphate adenylyltransferase
MSTKRVCVYPGTFSPITLGHEWIIEEALKIFDVVNVLVAFNKLKRSVFSLEERMDLVEKVTKKFEGKINVIKSVDRYTVDISRDIGATHIIRGIRSGIDFDYERTIDLINRDITHGITGNSITTIYDSREVSISTIYMTPPRQLSEVSSSMVMSLVGFDGWIDVVKNYVSLPVLLAIQEAYDAGHLAGAP